MPASRVHSNLAYTPAKHRSLESHLLIKRKFVAILSFVTLLGFTTLAGASDGPGRQEKDRWEAHAEKKYTMTFETTKGTNYCESKTSIDYYQDDIIAKVNGEISVQDCSDASGEYTISVRFRDEYGETHNIDFDETWELNSSAPLKFAKEYLLAENVDLIRVRARRTRCICNDEKIKPEATE